MNLDHICSNCGRKGELWLPKATKDKTVTCPGCGIKEDISHVYNQIYNLTTIEEYEKEQRKQIEEERRTNNLFVKIFEEAEKLPSSEHKDEIIRLSCSYIYKDN